MELLDQLPTPILILIGFLAGILSMLLLKLRDKKTSQRLSTRLTVAEEKLKALDAKESECHHLQQQAIETKTANADLQARLQAFLVPITQRDGYTKRT